MVRRWYRLKEPGWRRSILINGIGAVATGIVLVIVAMTKFTHGAWMVIAAMPVLIAFFLAVRHHYRAIGRVLRDDFTPPAPEVPMTFVLLVRDLGPATSKAIGYLRAVRPDDLRPMYVGDPRAFGEVARRWPAFASRMRPLTPPATKHEPSVREIRARLRRLRDEAPDRFLTVVIPETVTAYSLMRTLTRRSGFWLKASLLFERGIVVTNVPLLPEELAETADDASYRVEPRRNVVVVPISGVDAATARTVSYAAGLNAAEVEAVFFSTDPEDQEPILNEWADRRMAIPLSIVDAPFRDLTGPMLDEVRAYTARPGTLVTVVVAELVVRRWWERLLHNQTALFLKRLLLFERNVVVTSVPFHPGGIATHEPKPERAGV
jgi:hypothetical protein